MKPLKAAELTKMAQLGMIRDARLLATPEGWTAQFNDGAYAAALENGSARFFASSDAALKFLHDRGVFRVMVDMTPMSLSGH